MTKEVPYNHVLLEQVKGLWIQSFRDSNPPYSLYQKLLIRCHQLDVAPWWMIQYAQEHNARDPIRYMVWMMKKKNPDRPFPDQGGTSYAQWEAETLKLVQHNQIQQYTKQIGRTV